MVVMVVRWPSCQRKSPNTLRRTATDCASVPTIAADRHGSCSARRWAWRAIASYGRICIVVSPRQCPTLMLCRSIRSTASSHAAPKTPRPWQRCLIRAGSRHSPGSWRIPRAADFAASTRGSCAGCRSLPTARQSGRTSLVTAATVNPPMISSPMLLSSTSPTDAFWPRILSEQLVAVAEPLTVALEPGTQAPPRAVVASAARALLDSAPIGDAPVAWPAWLAPHQVPAAERLTAIMARHGGALLADEVGLGKSYVALAVALAYKEPFGLVVPAVLVPQWRALLDRFGLLETPVITHESLSVHPYRPLPSLTVPYRLFVVDEAHRFRNPDTNRYRNLARLVVGSRVLLVTATPVHNRIADLLHLLRLFLRDHALAALGVPSLRNAARREADRSLAHAAVARVIVARSRERVQTAYDGGPVRMVFPRPTTAALRAGPAPDGLISDLAAGVAALRAGGGAAPLLRLMLLRRLGSSLPAFRAALARHDAYLDLAARAAAEGRALTPREFQRCFPRAAESDIQLVLFPLLLDHGGDGAAPFVEDRRILARLRELLARASAVDPKADGLDVLLAARAIKTIVFTDAQPTARYLL